MSNLPVKRSNSDLAPLHDNGLRAGSLIEQSLASLTREQTHTLRLKAAEKAFESEANTQKNNDLFDSAKKSVSMHVQAAHSLPGRVGESHRISSGNIKTGNGTLNIESRSGASCFVASVAYNDPNHPDVMFLRAFRDTVLTNSALGRSFINWYGRHGPQLRPDT
jgi:hypothetical protein